MRHILTAGHPFFKPCALCQGIPAPGMGSCAGADRAEVAERFLATNSGRGPISHLQNHVDAVFW